MSASHRKEFLSEPSLFPLSKLSKLSCSATMAVGYFFSLYKHWFHTIKRHINVIVALLIWCRKNKRISKGKKGGKKKVWVLIFSFFIWYSVFSSCCMQFCLWFRFLWRFLWFFYLINVSVDPYAKKDWYDVKAPSVFGVRNVGKTLVTRTQGTKVLCSINLWIYIWYFGSVN